MRTIITCDLYVVDKTKEDVIISEKRSLTPFMEESMTVKAIKEKMLPLVLDDTKYTKVKEEVWFRTSRKEEPDTAVTTDKSNAVYSLYVKEK
jgi:hypothetical protein